ncbi:MAG: nucleotidyltransferase family protein [Hyphomicrobiales bacterium]
MTSVQQFSALILAAGRGPDDVMAKAFNIPHKCLVPVGGVPMIKRVVGALNGASKIADISICIDDPSVLPDALGDTSDITVTKNANSAPSSVLSSIDQAKLQWPILVTTADHALLTPEIVDDFLAKASQAKADIAVGLASRETIQARFPDTKRTYFPFSDVKVSGCNLFALFNARALNAVSFWHQADQNRKKPWKIVGAFGVMPLINWAFGRLSLEAAFSGGSEKIGAQIAPVLLPFAEAAVDVDKPEDKELVDKILANQV